MWNSKYLRIYLRLGELYYHFTTYYTNIFLKVALVKSVILLMNVENKVKHYNIVRINTLLPFLGK